MSNHIQALRDEINRAQLTDNQKAEAVEVIDEVEKLGCVGETEKGGLECAACSFTLYRVRHYHWKDALRRVALRRIHGVPPEPSTAMSDSSLGSFFICL